jgi:hypothetical protein
MLLSFLKDPSSLSSSISKGLVSAVVLRLKVGEEIYSDSVTVWEAILGFSLIILFSGGN